MIVTIYFIHASISCAGLARCLETQARHLFLTKYPNNNNDSNAFDSFRRSARWRVSSCAADGGSYCCRMRSSNRANSVTWPRQFSPNVCGCGLAPKHRVREVVIFYIIVVPVTINDIADTSNIRQGTSRITSLSPIAVALRLPVDSHRGKCPIHIEINFYLRSYCYNGIFHFFNKYFPVFISPVVSVCIYFNTTSLRCNCLPIHIEIKMRYFTHSYCYSAVFCARVRWENNIITKSRFFNKYFFYLLYQFV